MKHLIVTGGCGFMGSHFVAHVLEKTDWLVTVYDWDKHYACDVSRPQRYGWGSRVALHLQTDLRMPLWELPDHDYLVSFASASHVDRSIRNPTDFITDNVKIAQNVLRACKLPTTRLAERIIWISTDEVLGPTPLGVAFKEDQAMNPSNPYSASKAAQEALCSAYRTTYGLPITCARCVNNFGSGQDSEKFLPIVVSKLSCGVPVTIHGEFRDGEWEGGSRSWIHARVAADAVLHLLRLKQELPKVVHVPGQAVVFNEDMVTLVAEIMGVEPHIVWENHCLVRPGMDWHYALDGSWLRETGWDSSTTFAHDLERTVEEMTRR